MYLICYFVRPFPTFFLNNFGLSVLILCNNFLCLSRAKVPGNSLNDLGGSLQLEHCTRSNPYDGISGWLKTFFRAESHSQTCWQIVQYLNRLIFFLIYVLPPPSIFSTTKETPTNPDGIYNNNKDYKV